MIKESLVKTINDGTIRNEINFIDIKKMDPWVVWMV